MQSYLKLQLESHVQKDISAPNQFPHFSSWKIPHALARILSLINGEAVHQSFSKFFYHLDLFEFQLTGQQCINFIKEESAVILFIIMEGEARLFDEKDQYITEMKAPSYHLTYIPKGNYITKLDAGAHKLFIITPSPGWIAHILQNHKQLKSLEEHFQSSSPEILSLPHCLLNKSTLNRLKKLLSKLPMEHTGLAPLNPFLSKLIKNYNEKLAFNNHTTDTVQQAKAKALSSYINQHFTNDKLVSFAHLKAHFAMSDRKLKEVAKIAFNNALKSHIIDQRMKLAVDLITSTDKKIREIALLSGYRDTHYFSRAFTLYYSKSPKKFRAEF